ncbi:MAG TPA: alpha/beta fold hydrolase [Burkholderiaceae bacterium]|nr:alpha/beta fold hydrolase [Burkholderiaceae bacterium]
MGCFKSLRRWLGNGLAGALAWAACSMAGAAAPVPTEDFYPDDCGLFKLRISPAAARCGYASVPLRHDDPASPRIRLGIVVIPAADAARRQPDPLFLAQGGPGGSTIGTFAQALIDDAGKRPTQDRDLVLWDQRGTYFSQPRLLCRELSVLPDDAGDEQQREAYRLCGQRLQKEAGDLSAFNSLENARDVDAVRVALGYQAFNFYGVSYGSELGQFLMREAPAGLRAVVLDAVVPLGFSLVTDVPAVKQQVMEQYARACQQAPACAAAYPSLARRYLELVERLDREPVPLQSASARRAIGVADPKGGGAPARPADGQAGGRPDGDTAGNAAGNAGPAVDDKAPRVPRMSGKDLENALYQTVYSREAVPLIPYIVHQAEQGDFSFALNFVQLMQASHDDMADAMYMTVVCAEYGDTGDPNLLFPGVIKRLADEGRKSARQILDLCREWQIRPLDKALLRPVRSDTPTLLLSGRFDPITPPAHAERVAAGLSHAYPFTFASGTHGQAFTVPCANRMIAAFLADPSRAPDGTCAQEAPPVFVTPDQLLALPGRIKGGSASLQDHAAAMAGPAIAVGVALVLLFSAVPLYSIAEIIRIFRRRTLALPDGWRGRLIASAPWVPVFTGFLLLAFLIVAAVSIAGAVSRNQLLLLVGALPAWVAGLTWGLLPYVLALVLMTVALVQLWRYRARSLPGRLYYTLLVVSGWWVCVALIKSGLTGFQG